MGVLCSRALNDNCVQFIQGDQQFHQPPYRMNVSDEGEHDSYQQNFIIKSKT